MDHFISSIEFTVKNQRFTRQKSHRAKTFVQFTTE